jgi:hypothetical protein
MLAVGPVTQAVPYGLINPTARGGSPLQERHPCAGTPARGRDLVIDDDADLLNVLSQLLRSDAGRSPTAKHVRPAPSAARLVPMGPALPQRSAKTELAPV